MVDGVASRDLDELLQRHEKEQAQLAEAETEFRLQSRLEATLPVMRRRWRSGWTQRRVAEVFVNVLEAVAPFQACHTALLEACREQGLDWRTVRAQAPDLARAERDYGDFLAVSSTAELWDLLCERMAGEGLPNE